MRAGAVSGGPGVRDRIIYQRHLLRGRTRLSITANTRRDGDEPLALAKALEVQPRAPAYACDDGDRAGEHLAGGDLVGAAVLEIR